MTRQFRLGLFVSMAAAVGLHVRPCWTCCWIPSFGLGEEIECEQAPPAEARPVFLAPSGSPSVSAPTPADAVAEAVSNTAAATAADASMNLEAEALEAAVQAFAVEDLSSEVATLESPTLRAAATTRPATFTSRMMVNTNDTATAIRAVQRPAVLASQFLESRRSRPVLRSMRAAVAAE